MALFSTLINEEVWGWRQIRSISWVSRVLVMYNTWLRCGEVPCREVVRSDGVERTSIEEWLIAASGWSR